MDYRHYVVNDNPSAAWAMYGGGYMDFSGNNSDATQTTRRIYKNELPDPGFEITPSPYTGLHARHSFDTTVFRSGARSLKSAANATTVAYTLKGQVPVRPNQTWRVTIWYLTDVAYNGTSGNGKLRTGTGPTNAILGVVTFLNTQTWAKAELIHTIPADGSISTLWMQIASDHTLGTIWFDDAEFVDISAGEKISDTVLSAETIIANDRDASLLVGANVLSLPSTVMDAGREREPFSLEAWFTPRAVTGDFSILGREGVGDGITFDGEAIHFSTSYALSGTCRATYYPLITNRVFYVVGVHEEARNVLYVDGQLVASTDLTDEQRTDGYTVATAGILSSGYNTTFSSAVVDGLAVYRRPLPQTVIDNHYLQGTRTSNPDFTSASYGGTTWELSDRNATLVYGDDIDWTEGLLTDTVISDNQLLPEYDLAGLTVAGTWKYGNLLNDLPVLAGSKIDWVSDGTFTVETSVDNEATWQVCTNGAAIPNIGSGFDTTGKSLAIRVTFPAGATRVTRLYSLSVRLYSSLDVANESGTQFFSPTGSATLSSLSAPAIERNHMSGARLTGGRAVITPINVPDEVVTTSAVEAWVKIDQLTTAPVTLLTTAEGGRVRWTGTAWDSDMVEVFVDGARLEPLNFVLGRFYHVVFNLLTPTSSAINLASNAAGTEVARVTIQDLATYKTQLTDQQINTLYRSALSVPVLAAPMEDAVKVTDSVTPPTIYAYAWSITSA